MTTETSRRALLAGATALGAGAAVNVTAITIARAEKTTATHGAVEADIDAELVGLYADLQRLHGEKAALPMRLDEFREPFESEVSRLSRMAGVPDNQDHWRQHHARLYMECQVEAERRHPEYVAALKADEAIWLKLDKVMERVQALPALTIAGLQVKAQAALIANEHLFEKSFDDLDWNERYIVDLVYAVGAAHYRTTRREETEAVDIAALDKLRGAA